MVTVQHVICILCRDRSTTLACMNVHTAYRKHMLTVTENCTLGLRTWRRNMTGARRWICSDRKCVHPDRSRWHFSTLCQVSGGHDLWRSLCICTGQVIFLPHLQSRCQPVCFELRTYTFTDKHIFLCWLFLWPVKTCLSNCLTLLKKCLEIWYEFSVSDNIIILTVVTILILIKLL